MTPTLKEAVMKYSYFKNEKGDYTIRHTDSVTEAETLIAFTDDAEKADFLCKAANAFKYNGEQKPKRKYVRKAKKKKPSMAQALYNRVTNMFKQQ